MEPYEAMGAQNPQSQEQVLFRAQIPVPYHAIKKNSRPIFKTRGTNRPFIGKSQRLKLAENLLVSELRSRARDHGLNKPIATRLRAVFSFGFPPYLFYTKKLVESKRLGDCTNLAEIVQDSLQKAGIIENDSLLAPVTIDRVCADNHVVWIELWAAHE